MIGDLDSALRAVAIGAWLLLLAQYAGVAMRGELRLPLALIVLANIAAMLAGGGLLLASSPAESVILMLAALAPFAVWLSVLRLIGQGPEPRTALVAALAVGASWAAVRYAGPAGEPAFYALRVLSFLFAADIVRAAMAGRARDTVPARRALRSWLAPLAALQAGLAPLAGIILGPGAFPAPISLAHAALTLTLAILLALALFVPERALLD
ncbi:hypothetical protein Ga0102493_113047 [Erythrobacter litoralis]|jgi:hypothetical protein|uniref:Uncharacterized protein n=1 Tax=Erythrobacter litoralis TaxID=39960 RepID=A0A074NL31_9SPHN|nr:hypothetical protein [Erythrobacter litoralis]AOL24044.1 hypothetical protein Ga0102493_113047 [Erythrobacter litoralis]KEO98482.1 hypothetical protein EH32_05050 [Erythrobacter litoralis]MEE4337233.1 hypothetical protein [Erythrobacter sp.]